MRFGIGERKRAAPRSAEHLPLVDAEVLAQLLDITDEIPGCVLFDRSVRRTLSRTTLIEQHDAIRRWVMELTILGSDATARTAVQKHNGLAVRIAALFVINLMQV